ncbi:MAG: DUF5666 domain-containing protein [Acidobacteriota bacterium]|nr:DUF5666 domain-containing protein [Acidobacteriota bacterium]
MIRLVRMLILATATAAAGVCQQDATPSAALAPANSIFSGTVTALTADSVTVVRKVPAKADVSRTFSRDARTKVEGPALKVKARVTVRYQEPAEGQFQALYIIVR